METNVVVARFTGYATVTDMRYRWDYGQKLKVEGIADLPDYFEVHFSNAPSVGTAKVWLGQNGVVDIPDEYLATGEPVYAWIFLHAGETDGETVYSILIPVKKRPKPVNDAPTPVQKSELDTAIAILQTASATATEQATIATGAATTATEAAETATSAVADVEAAATRAEQAAASLTVDSALSETSKNPVQNKVVTGAVADLKSHFNEISGSTRNLFNIADLQIGKAWNLANNSARAIVTIPIEPNTKYTLSWTIPNVFDGIYHVEKVSATDTTAMHSGDATSSPKTFTTTATSNFLVVQFSKTAISKTDFSGFVMQLEKGENATSYIDHYTAVDKILRATAVKNYNSVSDMKADMLIESGDRLATFGYYSVGDGGRAKYVARTIEADTADDSTIIQLDNGLVAELIIENSTVNIKQLGAKPQDDSRHDIVPYLSIFENRLRNVAKLYIPMGVWNCSGYLFTYPVHIMGDYVFTRKNNGGMIATIITFYSNGQEYIFKLSDSTSRILPDCIIENITFSNSVYTINGNNYGVTGAYGGITDALLVADGLEFSTFNNLSFMYFNCTAMDLLGCCELFFHNTNIRGKDGTLPCIIIQKDSLRVVSSSIKFDFMQVEAILGNIFSLKNHVTNCDFGSIMFEPNQPNSDYIRIPCNDSAYDDTNVIRQAVFNLDNTYVQGCHVGNLCMDGFSAYGIKISESATYAYIYDCIFNGSSSQPLFVTFDAIDLSNAIKDFYLFNNANGNIGGSVSFVSFGDINVSSNSGANKIIKPIINCQYVPKFSYRSRENTAKSNMIFAYDLFRNTIDAKNTSVSIVGNSNMVNLDGCIANPKCAIRGFTPGNNRTDIPNIRLPYCKLYTKMHVHYSATANKESKFNFTNESNVSVSWISEQALGQWNWVEIDISNLNIAEGYQDINYEVETNSSGFIDCILLT